MRNREFVLQYMREAIRKMRPDYIFLQEVHGEHRGHQSRIEHWPVSSQFEYLADGLWPHFAYGRNAVYDHGHHGNAILSKYPILHWENEDVSTNSIEKRGLLHAVVRPYDDRPDLHLICAHFGLFERDRRIQASRLCARVHRTVKLGQGVVVAGDFNDWALRLTKFFKREIELDEAYVVRHQRHARTFPVRMPLFRLDRIYFHGFQVRLACRLQKMPWTALSDHAAVLADFEWP